VSACIWVIITTCSISLKEIELVLFKYYFHHVMRLPEIIYHELINDLEFLLDSEMLNQKTRLMTRKYLQNQSLQRFFKSRGCLVIFTYTSVINNLGVKLGSLELILYPIHRCLIIPFILPATICQSIAFGQH
jgi:hypothetical protein